MGFHAMQKHFVLTLTGPDRIGIVERVTGMLLDRGGNVETSRMIRLGGEFAILMLVSMPADRYCGLDFDLEALTGQGYKVAAVATDRTHGQSFPGWLPYRIEVQGADHEGIIYEVSRYLAERGINIESIVSETTAAPISGSPLFSMTAEVVVPPSLPAGEWEPELAEIGNRMNLEVSTTAAHEPRGD